MAKKRKNEEAAEAEKATAPAAVTSADVSVGGAPPRAQEHGVTAEQYVGKDTRVGKAGFLAHARLHLPKRMTRDEWAKAEAAHMQRPVR